MPLSLFNTEFFLICFSVVDPPSLANIERLYHSHYYLHYGHKPGTRKYTDETLVPWFLVGLKPELRADPENLERLRSKMHVPVDSSEGEALARKLGARGYRECSGLRGTGVHELMDEVVAVWVKERPSWTVPKPRRVGGCIVM